MDAPALREWSTERSRRAARGAARSARAPPPDAPPSSARCTPSAGRLVEARAAWLRAGTEADRASRWAGRGLPGGGAGAARSDPEEIEARLRLARMLRFRGRLAESLAWRTGAREPSASPGQRRTAVLLRAKVLSRQGSHALAIALLTELADEARGRDDAGACGQALEALAEAQADGGDLDGVGGEPAPGALLLGATGLGHRAGAGTDELRNILAAPGQARRGAALLEQAIPVLRFAGRISRQRAPSPRWRSSARPSESGRWPRPQPPRRRASSAASGC